MSCKTPFYVEHKLKGKVPVPCGSCPDCRKRRASAWSFRLMQEDKVSISAFFITLTYNTNHVPITVSGYPTLHRPKNRDERCHLQAFIKRVRYYHSKRGAKKLGIQYTGIPIRYYAVGEYGSKRFRPHYHCIIFNAHQTALEKSWRYGTTFYGTVTGASIGYCLKYISKPGRVPVHKNDDRSPEFSLMSKGLGLNYLTPAMKAWHLKNITERCYCKTEDGKKIAMPRYYKDKLYTDYQRSMIAESALIKINKEVDKKMEKQGDLYFHNEFHSANAAFMRMGYRSQLNLKI